MSEAADLRLRDEDARDEIDASTDLRGPEAARLSRDGSIRQAELPRTAAAQILSALHDAPGTIDITLDPEELGRVTLSLDTDGNTITVHVTADRQDTADLIRRHVDILRAEARAAGFDDVAFDMSGGGASPDREAQDGAAERRPAQPPAFGAGADALPTYNATARSRTATGGLDIRL